MGKVFRCYVEKKPGFDVEAGHLLGELKGTLGLEGLTGLRVIPLRRGGRGAGGL